MLSLKGQLTWRLACSVGRRLACPRTWSVSHTPTYTSPESQSFQMNTVPVPSHSVTGMVESDNFYFNFEKFCFEKRFKRRNIGNPFSRNKYLTKLFCNTKYSTKFRKTRKIPISRNFGKNISRYEYLTKLCEISFANLGILRYLAKFHSQNKLYDEISRKTRSISAKSFREIKSLFRPISYFAKSQKNPFRDHRKINSYTSRQFGLRVLRKFNMFARISPKEFRGIQNNL